MFTMAQARKAVYPYPVYEAHFSDGSVQRMSFFNVKGKPWDFARGRAVCESARRIYRSNPAEIVAGYVEWDERGGRWHRDADPLGAVVAMPKRRQAKAALRKLLAYLDGEHDDESVIDLAREAIAA